MAGELGRKAGVALKVEAQRGVFTQPAAPDFIVTSSPRFTLAGETVDPDEYTGSIHKPGAAVIGSTAEMQMTINLRGPGGTTPPAADAFLIGRVLRTAGFTEIVDDGVYTPTASTGGTANSATLGATEPSTANALRGLAIDFPSMEAGKPVTQRLNMIRSYSAAKLAELMWTYGTTISTAQYRRLKQLAYILSSATPPSASISHWVGGVRYDLVGMAVSSFRLNFPTAGRGQANTLPTLEVTYSGALQNYVDEASPVVTPTLGVPIFRNGVLSVAQQRLGGSSLSIDLGAGVAYPPNPNQESGNDAGITSETNRSVNLALNHVSKATFDWIDKARLQAQHPIFASYGLGSGNHLMAGVPNARFNFPSPDATSEIAQMTGDAFIDGADASIALAFPYY